MTIMEALKEGRGIRVTYGNHWMVWDKKMGWVVHDEKYNQRRTRFIRTTIVTTMDEGLAVKYLLYQEV